MPDNALVRPTALPHVLPEAAQGRDYIRTEEVARTMFRSLANAIKLPSTPRNKHKQEQRRT
jgi:hypothetical protein